VAFGVGAHRDRHRLEHFSEDDQSQLDQGKNPGPKHKRQPDLNDHSRPWTYPGVSIHFALLPECECGLRQQIRYHPALGGKPEALREASGGRQVWPEATPQPNS
jgi:hypothetical protein